MKVQVAYPVPYETKEVWETFKPFVQRFCDTWKHNPPGIRCTLFAITCGRPPDDEIYDIFAGTPVRFEHYKGDGMDLGAQQFLAHLTEGNAFQVNMTSRCYFHREGWLLEMLKQRLLSGPGLYGCSSSNEGGKWHICTRAFAYDTDDFKLYPHDIYTRDQGVFFECESLTAFFEALRRECQVVLWNNRDQSNSFRCGDQSAMLVWDKHTDAYAEASPEEKERLRNLMMYGALPCETT